MFYSPIRTIIVLALLTTTLSATAEVAKLASLEEVLVYARKSNENQQTVPISMVVSSGEALERAEISDFNDITKIAPGLTITSASPTSSSIKIRGVGLAFFGLAADPGVVITVDEFPQSRIGAVFGAFLDVQQVEVLKGPQGTLYGRNAPSGVISIWSRKPDYRGVHGRADVSSSSFNTLNAEGAINLPLVDDTLAVRLAHIHTESDGNTDLARYDTVQSAPDDFSYIYTGEKVHADEKEGDATRATMLFEPAQNLSLTARFGRTDYAIGQASKVADGPLAYTDKARVLDANGDIFVADRNDNLSFQDNLDYTDFALKEGGLRAQWTPEAGRLVSLSQYQEFDTQLSETIDGKPAPLAQPRILSSNDELYSQELRWHANLNESTDYLLGLYYAHQDIYITYEQLEQATGQLITVYGTQEVESWAVFANMNYTLDEYWSFSLGGRYNEETESIDGNLDLSAILGGGDNINIGQLRDKILDDNFSFSFKTRYQLNQDVLLYLALDSAYKSGGYNPQLANTSAFFVGNENIAALEADFLRYPAEESQAIELGLKSIWFEQRLLLNLAVFYQDFDDFQNFAAPESERIGGFSLGVLINSADKINTQGVELELSWLISDEWNASFTSTFANATVDNWEKNFCVAEDETEDPLQLYCPLSGGSRLNDDHKWFTNSQIDYRTPLGSSNMTFFSHLSWSFRGESGGDNDNSRSTVDFNIGVEIGDWTVKAWTKNLLDDEDFGGRTNESDVEGIDNLYLDRNIEPRTLGVTAIYTFGDE